jgi:hypothetical protein
MQLFKTGIIISNMEYQCLLYVEVDPEQWMRDTLKEKGRLRRDALIKEWRPRLFADPAVTELPADDEGLCALIMARSDYKTRLQKDAALDPPEPPFRNNIARYETADRSGATVTLFSDGMDITDIDVDCIMAYVQDLDDWILGALLGHINRGKKKMIAKYEPIIRADPSVTTMPATEDGLINMIVARSDYMTLPAQLEFQRQEQEKATRPTELV